MSEEKEVKKRKPRKKAEPKKPALKKLDFKEKVETGKTVTIESQPYVVMEGNKLKSKTTGEMFSY